MLAFKVSAVVLGAVIAAYTALAAYGAWRWRSDTEALFARLAQAQTAPPVVRYDERELDGLPAPVQRFFRRALAPGQPIVTAVRVRHTGTFNSTMQDNGWSPFSSRQHVTTSPPGFVWDGTVRMLPGVAVRVHDAYVAGEGLLRPSVLGVFSLAELRGGGAVAEGELMRWFAEAAWYPTALLPSQGVRWQAVDDRAALATVTDHAITLTLRFEFNADGSMAAVRSDARGRTVGSTVVPTPWEGRWSDYAERGGMRVPLSGEVAWLLPEGRKPYWRGTIETIDYTFAAR